MKRYTPTDVLFVLSVAVGLSIILGVGPHVQNYLVSLVKSNESSIYASAYNDGIVSFSGIWPWLRGLVDYLLLACALIVSIIVCRLVKTRDIFLVSSISVFLLLTLVDAIYVLGFFGDVKSRMSENVVANFIGAPVVAGYIVILLWGMKGVMSGVAGHDLLKKVVALSFPPASAFIIAVGAFLLITLFYNPTPASVYVILNPGSSGWFWLDEKKGKKESTEKPFKILTKTADFNGKLSINQGKGPLSIDWRSKEQKAAAKVKVSVLYNCHPSDLDEIKISPLNSIELNDIKSVELSIGGEESFLYMPVKSGKISMPEKDNTVYWFNNDEKDKLKSKPGSESADAVEGAKKELVVFAADAELKYESSRPKESVYIYSSLLNGKGKLARHYSITLNDKKIGLIARYSKAVDLVSVMGCSQAAPLNLDNDNSFYVMSTIGYFGIYVEIEQPSSLDLYFDGFSTMDVTGINGWIYAHGLSNENLDKVVQNGKLKNIQFRGDVNYIEIDGEEAKARPAEWYTFMNSDVDGFFDEGLFYLSGKSRGVYKDKVRQNKTRWEKLPLEIQIAILSILGVLMVAVMNFLFGLLRSNEDIGCRSL